MDFFRHFFKTKQTPQKLDLVVVGRLTDEEILAHRQIDVIEQEIKDLHSQLAVKELELKHRLMLNFLSVRKRLGIAFASMHEIGDDYQVRIPRDEARKHGLLGEFDGLGYA